MAKFTTKDKIIEFLISEYNKDNTKTNEINISKIDIENINLSESDASKTIHLLETSGYLRIKYKSAHNDFSRFWTVILNDSCIEYFSNQKNNKKKNRRKSFEEFRAWITLIISILAFVLSIYALYLQYLPVK